MPAVATSNSIIPVAARCAGNSLPSRRCCRRSNRVLKRIAVYAVLFSWPAFALAAEPGNPAIRTAVEKFIDARDVSGAVTVVAAKDKLLAVDTIGLADIAKKKPMKLDSLFWIASMTKPFTAVSILMLQ